MLLTANEGRQQHAFFIPQLGPAPKWCAFLDNIVEEMAEDPDDPNAFNTRSAGEIYDNFKFLTLAQLRQLNLDHLVGSTSLLRPYMHGYFVAQKLYEEARLISNPDLWQEQRAKSIQEKISKERESRIRGSKKASWSAKKKPNGVVLSASSRRAATTICWQKASLERLLLSVATQMSTWMLNLQLLLLLRQRLLS
jgi:ribosome biogenesis protein ENP2